MPTRLSSRPEEIAAGHRARLRKASYGSAVAVAQLQRNPRLRRAATPRAMLHVACCCTLHDVRCTSHVVACCMLHVARCMLHVARHTLRAMLFAACYALHIARCTLHAACCAMHIVRCMLYIARCMKHVRRCALPCCRSNVARRADGGAAVQASAELEAPELRGHHVGWDTTTDGIPCRI